MTAVAPRTGPCSPWVTAADVVAQPGCAAIDPGLAAKMATVASEMLYILSGQQFTGACGPVTVRPISRPTDQDTRGIAGLGFSGSGGYLASWGSCTAYGAQSGAINHFGCSNPPEVELGAYPITEIELVKIDGIVIPPNEYFIQDYRTLVRRRPSAGATPTERWGWPTCQLIDLPSTEVGTFSVTYLYGVAPPAGGALAAAVLAGELALDQTGKATRLPKRVTSLTRQGVAAMIVDPMDFLKAGLTGIYDVDLWLRTINPGGNRRKAIVFSPDMGRPRRMPAGTS